MLDNLTVTEITVCPMQYVAWDRI